MVGSPASPSRDLALRPAARRWAAAWLAWAGAVLGLAGCDDGAAAGAACVSSKQCLSNLCYANVCLVPTADNDGDGLKNRDEHRLGSHPLLSDSDGDGKPDGAEVGPNLAAPADHDGDGKPDVVESALADRDNDCLPDEIDSDDAHPLTDPVALAKLACSHLGVCALAEGAIEAACKGGELVCDNSKVPGFQASEACDGIDNDCDGSVDEGFVYQGAAIGAPCSGIGTCGAGVVVCAIGHATCSTNPDGSQPRAQKETCNGKDDDCDGQTDEDFALGGVAVGSPCLAKGECGIGSVVCGGDGAPVCSTDANGPNSRAKTEICNGRDDNCDGATDEGMQIGGAALGQPCASPGVCGAGKVVCGPKGEPACSSAAGMPGSPASDELCNFKDDDCDGLTDEGMALGGQPLGTPCAAKGACGKGVLACSNQGTVTCSTAPDSPTTPAKPELCNGLDDDCDGQTDEGLAYNGKPLGAPCVGLGICGTGTVVCGTGGATTCSTNSDGGQSQAQAESCNGKDDDCDGKTDDGVPPPAEIQCAPKGVCVALQPLAACVAGAWACDYNGQSGYEAGKEVSCDGVDNNCDGQTDEGLAVEWTAVTAWDDGRPLARRWPAWANDAAGNLWVAGGLETAGSGEEVLGGELWRLQVPGGTWAKIGWDPLLRRQGSAAVWAPDGQLWLLGGTDTQGKPAAAVAVNKDTGKAAEIGLPAPPTAVTYASAAAVGKAVWLLGTAIDGTAPVMLRAQDGAWSPAPPPPGDAAIWTACATGKAWFAIGLQSSGQATFAAFDFANGQWASLATNEFASDLISAGRLFCGQGGQVWWLGAARKNGKVQAPLRYNLPAGPWQPLPLDVPAIRDPLLAGSAESLWMALGADAAGVPQADAFVQLAGAFTAADAEPPTAVGAAWVGHGGAVWRVGGAAPRGQLLVPLPEAWSWTVSAGWKRTPFANAGAARAFGGAVRGPQPNQILYFGGVTATAGASQTAQLLSEAAVAASPGGFAIDAVTGAVTELPDAILAKLPPVKADFAVTATLDPAVWFVFGAHAATGAPTLWRIDWSAATSVVWPKAPTAAGPVANRGTAISHDPLSNRLLLAQIDGGLKVYTLQLPAAEAWVLAAEDPAVQGNRAALLGAPGHKDRLLVTVAAPGKGPAQLRRLALGLPTLPGLNLEPIAAPAPPWWGAMAANWTGAFVAADGTLGNDGRFRTARERVLRTCPKAP